LVLDACESILRALSVNEDLGFADLPFRLLTLEEAKKAKPFDVFILVGNELFPTHPVLGKRNYFICQFPFPVPDGFLSHYRHAGYYQDYDSYVVYSEYVRTHVAKQLDAWNIKLPIVVLSPTADLVGTTGYKGPDIISVGRFFTGGHNKRHDIMIEVMKQVTEAAPELQVTLHLAGAVHNAEVHRRHLQTLRELAQGLPILFHVDVERPVLDALYRSSKVYLHAGGWGVDTAVNPEAVEHFGISILEAMSAGCVPVAYAVGGPTETIRHGVNGVLVVSVAEMADWTIRLLRDWDTPLVRAMRDSAVRTAQSYGKPAFGARVRQLITLTPREEDLAHCRIE
jgi:glycosyltransferase involved in cell wall biosynthesis